MSDTYVLVHGAWHTGELLEPAAQHIRKQGHTVHCPTLKGNRPGDDRSTVGLEDAAQSVCDYLLEHDLKNVRLAGHSYGGMIISRVADVMPERIARLIYVNAFVPNPGECLNDMVPPHYKALFDQITKPENLVRMPSLLAAAGKDMKTDLGPMEIGGLITAMGGTKLDAERLGGRPFMRDGISYWEAEWPKPSSDGAASTTSSDRYGSVF